MTADQRRRMHRRLSKLTIEAEAIEAICRDFRRRARRLQRHADALRRLLAQDRPSLPDGPAPDTFIV